MAEISFADYKHDMDELGDRAAGIISQQRRQIQDLKRSIVALVASAGKIEVSDHVLANADRYELLVERNEADGNMVYRAKRQ